MSNFSQVVVIGRATKDSELRYTASGKPWVGTTIAFNSSYKDKKGEWQEDPTFIDVSLFDERADSFAQRVKKGDLVLVEGSLRQSRWEDPQGNKRSSIKVVAKSYRFLREKGVPATLHPHGANSTETSMAGKEDAIPF